MWSRRRSTIFLCLIVAAVTLGSIAIHDSARPSAERVATVASSGLRTVGPTTTSSSPATTVPPSLRGPVPVGSVQLPVPGQVSPSIAAGGTVGTVPSLPTATVALPDCSSSVGSSPNAAISVSVSMIAPLQVALSQQCFTVPVNTPIRVTLTNHVVDRTTGLIDSIDVVLSSVSEPALAPVVGNPTAQLRNANSAATLFESPSANDGSPITFTLPALGRGQYLLQPNPLYGPAALLVAE